MPEHDGTAHVMKKKESKLVTGMAIGVAIGTAVGVGTDNLGLWISLGIAIGTAVGFAMMKKAGNADGDASA
ncbi:MAG TPA: hypothetical protein PLV08_03110 [Flavobacteriales bacterium]|jgi:hypothetical protein|nr:hypothetical protein [Flavobacteriales bacterium]HQW98750.1 hypothetical protein [Flavobacteriales bacterium]HQX98741.1 hypothetical protein [Flavobacteriales bacterium]